jgi:hypothetical protein
MEGRTMSWWSTSCPGTQLHIFSRFSERDWSIYSDCLLSITNKQVDDKEDQVQSRPCDTKKSWALMGCVCFVIVKVFLQEFYVSLA